MSSDGGPSAKRPKFDQDDDELHPGIQERRASIASTGGDKSSSRGGESFPQQLMKMLNDPANSEIVAWVPSGDAFMVHSKDQFVTEVMPAYFGKQSKFTSFTRKLNRWGFTRDSQDQNKGAYSHPLFHRDDPTSHEKMSCVSQAGQGAVRGGGKAKRRNSGPMAMSKANARVPAGEATAVAGDAGVGAGLAGAMGVGLITPQIPREQLTSQMMFGSQGLSDSAGGFAGLSPFGFTPMAMTPGTLSIVSNTRGMRNYYFYKSLTTYPPIPTQGGANSRRRHRIDAWNSDPWPPLWSFSHDANQGRSHFRTTGFGCGIWKWYGRWRVTTAAASGRTNSNPEQCTQYRCDGIHRLKWRVAGAGATRH